MERVEALWRRHHRWLGIAVTAVLAAACYGFVLRLPFFYDDLPIMTWLSRHSWADIWTQSSENQFYRPLPFSIYKMGRLFPSGIDRAFLHGVSLSIHWVSALLIAKVVALTGGSAEESLVASILFVVFPFMFMAIPWITAMSHPLVTMLVLLAAVAALKAEKDGAVRWWGVSLLATILASTAHESGQVCAVIAGGMVFIQYGLRSRRRVLFVALGLLLNGAMLVTRSFIPGVGDPSFSGAQDFVGNAIFFMHGLIYPMGPAINWLVNHSEAQDLGLVALGTAGFIATAIWLVLRNGNWRWAASGLWWWVCAALPAGLSLRYGYLYTAPRVYTLAAAGTVILWSKMIFEVSSSVKKVPTRRAVAILIVGVVAIQNLVFLQRQFELFSALNGAYQQALDAADEKENEPLGLVNLPAALAHRDKAYAMILETVLFVPPYSNISEFIEVNSDWRSVDAVMYTPVLRETEFEIGFQGQGLDWEGMRRFALEHTTVWLTEWHDGRFSLNHVGSVKADATPSDEPLVRFEGGVAIESTAVEQMADGRWAVTIIWLAQGPVDGEIFVHVVDAGDDLVGQADGPALGGMVPPWAWHAGDRIHDVRYVLPRGAAPYTVKVGLYDSQGRLPAVLGDIAYPDGAPPVATIPP